MTLQLSKFKSIKKHGFFDRHPILVPASLFFICWIPYIVVFMRKSIAFGNLGNAYPIDGCVYWALFIVQLGVCVISHSLTIRTIVRLYAPCWLIWGSVAFYSLSPAWGLMTAADIRHPLFAAVFCVFTSSCTFALYSERPPKWLWVQLAGGALSVCLLRAEGIWIILPTLVLVLVQKAAEWWNVDRKSPMKTRLSSHFKRLNIMHGNPHKKEESLWSDMCAAFLVLSAVGLLFLLTYCVGWALPLGEPSFGSISESAVAHQYESVLPLCANLTGTNDVGGIMPFATITDNSLFEALATTAGNAIFAIQCFPIENLTFSWIAYLILFMTFLLFSIMVTFGWKPRDNEETRTSTQIESTPKPIDKKRSFDFRPLILGLSMVIIIAIMIFTPADMTLRYLMPVLAAQPMFFGSIFASIRKDPKTLEIGE